MSLMQSPQRYGNDGLRGRVKAGPQFHADSPQDVRTLAIEGFTRAIDEKLLLLRSGQALAIEYRVEVMRADFSFVDEPDARNSAEAQEWRRRVFERDAYTCQDCPQIGGKLHAHHIEAWADCPEKRFELSNGLTLCLKCHGKRHPKHAALIAKSKYHDA